jgi:small subunit ribosomal protein S4
MGDIKRKSKKFGRPKKPFDKPRIETENKIVDKFGLKNKREIWKAEAQITKIRKRAKKLIPKSDEEKKEFFEKLKRQGFKANDISDVLGFTVEDWLDRRLQTFVLKKGFANTAKQSRQLITHKKIAVDGKIVNKPSFFVMKDLENKIELKLKPKKKKVVEEVNEAPAEVSEEGESDGKE